MPTTAYEIPQFHWDLIAKEQAACGPAFQRVLDMVPNLGMAVPDAFDWDAAIDAIADPEIEFPKYYTLPVHSLPGGYLNQFTAAFDRAALDAIYWDDDANHSLGLRDRFAAHVPAGARRIVDFGCGTGDQAAVMAAARPDAEVIGMDLSPHMLAVAAHTHAGVANLSFRHANVEHTGLDDGSVDCVGLTLVLHEVPDTVKVSILSEAARILSPNGVLLFCDNTHDRLEEYRGAYEPYREQWRVVDIDDCLAQAGLEVTERDMVCDSLWLRVARPVGA